VYCFPWGDRKRAERALTKKTRVIGKLEKENKPERISTGDTAGQNSKTGMKRRFRKKTGGGKC